jgi:hydrogenase maturation protease
LSVVVIGLGNPILGDDGIGWCVAERIRASLSAAHPEDRTSFKGLSIEVECLSVGGLSLMEHLVGYQRAIIIDAITSHTNPPGKVTSFPLEDLPTQTASHLGSAHDTSLQTAIQMGRTLGASLPEQVHIIAIEAQAVYEFSEQLTSLVAAAAPTAMQAALEVLARWADAECPNSRLKMTKSAAISSKTR